MKITESQLKQIIKEEVQTIVEQQSPEDLGRQSDWQATAEKAVRAGKYGTGAHDTPSTKSIDLLTEIRDLLQQILDKP
jgi:hypothetical protein